MSSPSQNVQNESLKTGQSVCLADDWGLAISCFLENSAPSRYLWVTTDHCKSCALLTLSARLLSSMAFLMTDSTTGRADVSLWFGTWQQTSILQLSTHTPSVKLLRELLHSITFFRLIPFSSSIKAEGHIHMTVFQSFITLSTKTCTVLKILTLWLLHSDSMSIVVKVGIYVFMNRSHQSVDYKYCPV